jgi:type IV fimbrial biogenesis protein FimT
MAKQRGFTLVELMVVVAVVAILASAALPSFSDLLSRQRVSVEANRLLGDLQYARAEAVTRHHEVVVCPASRQSCVGGGDWSRGWMVFVDGNENGQRDGNDLVLKVGQSGQIGRLYSSSARPRVRFKPDGSAGGNNATITVCSNDASRARAIIVSNPGRSRVSTEGPGGRALRC